MLDELYRWKWWISGGLAALLVFATDPRIDDGPTWIVIALFALLVWLPAAIRWAGSAQSARPRFRERLDGR